MTDQPKNRLITIHDNISALLKSKAEALPKGFNQTRFLQNCIVVLQDTKDIEKMEPRSVARTMLKGAFMGLDFFNRECYAIPYNKNIGTKQKAKWVPELQFQTDYKGEIKLAKKYSLRKIHDIYAKLVREGDRFEEIIIAGQPSINFTPKPFNPGKIIGAFAVAIYEDTAMIYESMSVTEMEEVKEHYAKKDGQGRFSPAWRNSKGEMYKKTVLRRLCKGIELEFESVEQKQAWDDSSDFEFKDVTDIEPIPMPKEITESAENDSDDTESGEEEEPPKEEKVDPEPPKAQKKGVSEQSLMEFGLDREKLITAMRSYAVKNDFDIELCSMQHFEKELDDLNEAELSDFESIFLEEVKKQK